MAHDIRMLARAYEEHDRNPFAYTAWFVHCRSVMEFFREPAKAGDDDIIADDFLLSGVTWADVRPVYPEPAGYARLRTAVNKLAAHLTYSRVEYEKNGRKSEVVPTRDVTNYLLRLAEIFIRSLPDERRGWFDDPQR